MNPQDVLWISHAGIDEKGLKINALCYNIRSKKLTGNVRDYVSYFDLKEC